LEKLGHSRTGKRGTLQIVFGLICNAAGCPVAVEVFAGNTADPATLAPQLQKLRDRFHLRRVVLVGDRGVLTHARIHEELQAVEGLDWITALRGPAIRTLVEAGALDLEHFAETDLFECTAPTYPAERLIACRNPALAEERARKREALLQATERELEPIRHATQRAEDSGDMAMREAPDNLEGVVGRDQDLPAQHTAEGFELRRRPMREIRQCPAFDLPVLPVAFAQQDRWWRGAIRNRGNVHASILEDSGVMCTYKIRITCLRLASEIDAIFLCDKSLRTSRPNNFGLKLQSTLAEEADHGT